MAPTQSDRSRRGAAFPATAGVVAALLALAGLARASGFDAPLLNWALPLFTNDNHRQMTARGSEARATGPRQFEVVDLNLTLFSGDAAARVDTVLLSPAATFDAEAKTAQGQKSVRFIRDDVEASGTRWMYWHEQKKISLDGNVRVTLRAELPALLQ